MDSGGMEREREEGGREEGRGAIGRERVGWQEGRKKREGQHTQL